MTKEDFINSLSNLATEFLDEEGDMKWAAQQLREMADDVEGWENDEDEDEDEDEE
jgi:hypothetical protein